MAFLKLFVCCATLVLAVNAVAQAQERIDMSKYTCEQMLAGSGDSIETAIWLSGYYNGLRKNTVLDTAKFSKNADLVIAECKASPKKTVMQTVNTMLSRKK